MYRTVLRLPCRPVCTPLAHPVVLSLAAVAWLGACGDPQPPVTCGTIPQQTLHVGETEVVTPCFEDPEMEPISLSAESSNPQVARASVSGDRVRVQGTSPGNATVTVTATDPDSLTGQLRFDVVVPNRPPEVSGTIPDVYHSPGGSSEIFLRAFFSDPDAQELAYGAEFSDPSVATGSVAGDILTTTAVGVGTTTGTATATDPGGLSVSQTFPVRVAEPQRLLRDDFETDESLANWMVTDSSTAIIADGKFWLANAASTFLGYAGVLLNATEWEVTAAMGNATSAAWAALFVGTDHERFSTYQFQIGADSGHFGLGHTDYRFLVFDESGPTWLYDDGWYGQSDAIGDVGELTEIAMAIRSEVLTVMAGSTELVRLNLTGTVLSSNATYLVLVTWPAGTSTGNRGFFDWIEVRGISLDNRTTDRHPAPLSLEEVQPILEIGPGDWLRRVEGRLIGSGNGTPCTLIRKRKE